MNSNQQNNKPKMNVPKPNLSWLYIIIIAALGILYFSSDEGSDKKGCFLHRIQGNGKQQLCK